MRGKSHICLGKYLSQRYMKHRTRSEITAFLIGCIEPDRNPATYLKGSIRFQWLRGHNYRNASRYMERIARRLEKKTSWNLWDFYTLGKLIHYTADAFTSAHNDSFPGNLSDHKVYEADLQNHFLQYIGQAPVNQIPSSDPIMDMIRRSHLEYEKKTGSISRDSRFALSVACCILALLFPVSM